MDLKIKTEKEEFHGRTCGIIKQEDKFLIMRVNKTSYYHIPGGHIEMKNKVLSFSFSLYYKHIMK